MKKEPLSSIENRISEAIRLHNREVLSTHEGTKLHYQYFGGSSGSDCQKYVFFSNNEPDGFIVIMFKDDYKIIASDSLIREFVRPIIQQFLEDRKEYIELA